MKHLEFSRFIIGGLAIAMTATLMTSNAWAGPPTANERAQAKKFCELTAKRRVADWNESQKYGCGLSGNGWSPSYAGHLSACTGVMNWALEGQTPQEREQRANKVFAEYNKLTINNANTVVACRNKKSQQQLKLDDLPEVEQLRGYGEIEGLLARPISE